MCPVNIELTPPAVSLRRRMATGPLVADGGKTNEWDEKAEAANDHLFRQPDGNKWTRETLRKWADAQNAEA